jgi:hypothetical protein
LNKDAEPSAYQKFLWWMFTVSANQLRPCSVFKCANRSIFTYRYQNFEMKVTFRDLDKPEGYSRVELLQMLQLIRAQEAKQNWKVPEPSLSENS